MTAPFLAFCDRCSKVEQFTSAHARDTWEAQHHHINDDDWPVWQVRG